MHVSLARPFIWLSRGGSAPNPARQPRLRIACLRAGCGDPGLLVASVFHRRRRLGFSVGRPVVCRGLVRVVASSRGRGSADFDSSLSVLAPHRKALIRFSAELLAIAAIWFAASTLMLHLALGGAGPSVEATIWGGVLEQMTGAQMISYVLIGGLLACLVFARSVVAVPLIIDRDVDSPTAVRTSIRVTLADLPAMILWAALIVIVAGVGFATSLVGMVAVFPLLGHATCHVYRDLVK
ncbi:DUF2189 domain-containing protein [Thiocapsa sp.]|uniref:DUF2189 domain-containing protein n=1 Tax=Thiocapsa sp. TaxID=2024551 RepID=UPI003593FEFC